MAIARFLSASTPVLPFWPPVSPQRSSAPATVTGRTGPILVIEDQPLIRQAWVQWLESDGWTVMEASSVDEALAAAAMQPPAVAVCDVSLGAGRSGVWAANRLLATPNPPQIIFATSHDMLPAKETLQKGVSSYLLKPFGRGELMSAVTVAHTAYTSACDDGAWERAQLAEVSSRRERLFRNIDHLEPWECHDGSTILARLNAPHETFAVELAERAAARMGLAGVERVTLRRAIELRNIGKLVMPQALLSAERSLQPHERKLLKAYASEGQQAVARCGFPEVAVWIGRLGHRWDGLDGEPETCAAEEAGPSLARVLTAFLAMIEVRPYRPALDTVTALDHLRRGAGTLFSPAAVDALAAAISEGPELLEQRCA